MQKELADSAQESVTEELRTGLWAVYPGCYTYAGSGDDAYVGIFGPSLRSKTCYAPLIDTPALVLELGELGSGKIGDEEWRDWIERYGVLGLHKHPKTGRGSDRGGGEETLGAFRREARRVHRVLRLYGAATKSPDGPDVGEIKRLVKEIEPRLWDQRAQREPVATALYLAGMLVQERLATEAHPQLYQTAPNQMRTAWGFRSLLGAIYLQAMFLLSATGKTRYCKRPGCYNPIDFDQPEHPPVSGIKKNDRSGGYRTRKDKAYCSDACKQRAYRMRKAGRA